MLALFLVAMLGGTEISVVKDIEYSPEGKKMDIYFPRNTSKEESPAVILLYAGGWLFGDKKDFSRWGSEFANAGIVAVVINYSMLVDRPPGTGFFERNEIEYHQSEKNLSNAFLEQEGFDPDDIDIEPTIEASIRDLGFAFAYVSNMPEVDGKNISLWGESAGGIIILHASMFGLVEPEKVFLYAAAVSPDTLAKASVPVTWQTLMIHGKGDPLFPIEDARQTAKYLSADLREREAGEGHFIMADEVELWFLRKEGFSWLSDKQRRDDIVTKASTSFSSESKLIDFGVIIICFLLGGVSLIFLSLFLRSHQKKPRISIG